MIIPKPHLSNSNKKSPNLCHPKKTQSQNQPRPEPTKEEENYWWCFRCDLLPVVVAEVVGLVPLTFGTQT